MAYRKLGDRQKAMEHLAKRGDKWATFQDPLIREVRDLAAGKQHFFRRASQAYLEGDLRKAAEGYRKIVEADPADPVARLELGSILAQIGEQEAAIEEFSQALHLAPGNPTALYNLGILYTRAGSSEQAVGYYEAAVLADPQFKQAHFQLANELMRMRRFGRALTHYEAVVKLDPGNAFARLMSAIALVGLQRYAEARGVLEDSHQALPEDPDIATALAQLLAASPNGAIRDGQRALAILQKVFQAQNSVDVEQMEALAMALAETRQFEKAIEAQQLMIAHAERAGRSELARILAENLGRYWQRKPCRQPWREDDPIFTPVPGTLQPISSGVGAVAGMQQPAR